MVTVIVSVIFLSVALITCAVLYPVLRSREIVRERVAKLVPAEEGRREIEITASKWQTFLARMGVKLRMKQKDLQTFQEMATASGFRRDSVYIILGGKLLLALSLPATYLFFYVLPQGKMTGSYTPLFAFMLAVAGYLVPTYWLSKRAEARKAEIFHSLPDVLDLLTVCVEAGLGLDAALMKTVENFQDRKNPLIRELDMVTREIRAGRPRYEALKGLAERTMVEDIKAFVTMLVQTERFGTSLGKTLRTYSDSMRTKRKQLAEERAGKTAVKMLFPLTFCIFPALMIVMLVPAFFRIYGLFER